ncbi:TPA_asm: G [Artemisia alphacytorhabdovirus 3]|nr:TPA_asm: G [Artemisia alphacytorhabdovirus 3]
MTRLSRTLHWILLCIVLVPCTSEARKGATPSSINTAKISIGPVADCTGNLTDLGVELRNCYMKCEGYSEPKSGVSINIYNSVADGPIVTSCSKTRISQDFTQTWTLSTIKGPIRREQTQISRAECEKEINEHCPTGSCDRRAPSELPEEYHFASTTTVSASVIELISAKSVLFIEEGAEMISPMGTRSRFPSDAQFGSSEGNLYFWNKVDKMSKCPHEMIGSYGCDEFDEGDEKFYACSGGGITVTPMVPAKSIHKDLCPGLNLSEEGFLYSMGSTPYKESGNGRLAINVNPDVAETAEATYLRHKIQQVAMKLGSDLCYTQCELMSLETRSSNKTEHLVRIGHEHYLAHSNGSATKCQPLQSCKIAKPSLFCGGPPRLGVICSGTSRLWNPMKPYLSMESTCPKPVPAEKLTFSLGTTVYNVDDKLEIVVPKTELHGVYQSEFLRYHNSRTTLKVEELNTMSDEWKAAKSGESKIAIGDNANRSVMAPHVALGSWFVSTFKGIQATFRSVEALIGIFVIVIVLAMTASLLMKLFKIPLRMKDIITKRASRSEKTRYRKVDESTIDHNTWI